MRRPRTQVRSSAACSSVTLPDATSSLEREPGRPEPSNGQQRAVERPAAAARRSRGCRLAAGRPTIGLDSSTRLPTLPTMRAITWRRCSGSRNANRLRAPVSPSRSAYTASGPLTITSVTAGSRHQAIERPEPQRVVDHLGDQAIDVGRRQRDPIRLDDFPQAAVGEFPQCVSVARSLGQQFTADPVAVVV